MTTRMQTKGARSGDDLSDTLSRNAFRHIRPAPKTCPMAYFIKSKQGEGLAAKVEDALGQDEEGGGAKDVEKASTDEPVGLHWLDLEGVGGGEGQGEGNGGRGTSSFSLGAQRMPPVRSSKARMKARKATTWQACFPSPVSPPPLSHPPIHRPAAHTPPIPSPQRPNPLCSPRLLRPFPAHKHCVNAAPGLPVQQGLLVRQPTPYVTNEALWLARFIGQTSKGPVRDSEGRRIWAGAGAGAGIRCLDASQ